MSSHPMEPKTETSERVSIRVVAYSNTTFMDPVYGELRTHSIGGNWDDTPKSRELAQRVAAADRARNDALGMYWTVEVVRETVTTTYTTVREAI